VEELTRRLASNPPVLSSLPPSQTPITNSSSLQTDIPIPSIPEKIPEEVTKTESSPSEVISETSSLQSSTLEPSSTQESNKSKGSNEDQLSSSPEERSHPQVPGANSLHPSPSQTPPSRLTSSFTETPPSDPRAPQQSPQSPSSISSEPIFPRYSVSTTSPASREFPQRHQYPHQHQRQLSNQLTSSASLTGMDSNLPIPLRRSSSSRSYHNQLQRDYHSPKIHQTEQYKATTATATGASAGATGTPTRHSYSTTSSRSPSLSPHALQALPPYQSPLLLSSSDSFSYSPSLAALSSHHFPPYASSSFAQDDDLRSVTDAATECGDPTELDLPDSEEVLILKEGFLMKKGFINTAFKRRWCVLRGRQILFYKNYTDRNIRGIINIQEATLEIAEDKRRSLPFAFYLFTPRDR
jgi:hypothetical protein